jgi:hypothetical protein
LEIEVWSVIRELKSDKASGPDGFKAYFFQTVWPIIKHDLLSAFAALWSLDCKSLYLIN